MNDQPNWLEAGDMLREAIEHYQNLKGYETLTQAIVDVAEMMPGRDPTITGSSTKTIRRDLSGEKIPTRRVELYVHWLRKEAKWPREWVAQWLENTSHPCPGEVLACEYETEGNKLQLYRSVKKNRIPSLKGHLWGGFLGRKIEIGQAIRWANNRRHPIAILWGFGGNGKTTIQLKIGSEFVFGRSCPLRWPYEAVVWVSARDYPSGILTLSDILGEILYTFEVLTDRSEASRVSPDWLRKESVKLLERRRTLILLDNFETVPQQYQEEILEFFGWLKGTSQVLISSRHSLSLGNISHLLIPVDGLSPKDAELFIEDYLQAKAVSLNEFEQADLASLAQITRNNPKAILAVMGLVEQGMSLKYLLNCIVTGKPDIDDVFKTVIDVAWRDILTNEDQAILMAKSFFSQPVSITDLAQVGGVDLDPASNSIMKLRRISFFERYQPSDPRIQAHPLAEDFSRRILREYAQFNAEAEHRWWNNYLPKVFQQSKNATFSDLLANPILEDDLNNILERLVMHIRDLTEYCTKAANLIAGSYSLGYVLHQWGKWDRVLMFFEIVLEFAKKQLNPRLLGESMRRISGVYLERGQYEKAHVYVALAIELNASLKDDWLHATIETELGSIYRRQGHQNAAKQLFQNALKTYLVLDETIEVAYTLLRIGGTTVEMTIDPLDSAINTSKDVLAGLQKAESYFQKSDNYYEHVDTSDPRRRFDMVATRAWRGVIARAKGNLEDARNLFMSCMGQFQSLPSTARLYRELALVEHLASNKDLARQYENRGLELQRQLGGYIMASYNCYNVIKRLKAEEIW